MGHIQSFRSVCLVTSRFKMMKLVLVLFVATVLISRSASNPVRHAKGVSIGGNVGHVCNSEKDRGCAGAQNGSINSTGKGPIQTGSGTTIHGNAGHVCNNETGEGCGGAQNGSTGKKKKRSIAQILNNILSRKSRSANPGVR